MLETINSSNSCDALCLWLACNWLQIIHEMSKSSSAIWLSIFIIIEFIIHMEVNVSMSCWKLLIPQNSCDALCLWLACNRLEILCEMPKMKFRHMIVYFQHPLRQQLGEQHAENLRQVGTYFYKTINIAHQKIIFFSPSLLPEDDKSTRSAFWGRVLANLRTLGYLI